ncbi:MAG TPA: hypothetical protein VF520_11710 [Thermoleophilaceae bacterium]
MRRSTYEPLLGTDFAMTGLDGRTVAIKLIDVSDLPDRPKRQSERFRERAFVLLFQGPIDQPLATDLYRVKHPKIGTFDLGISSALVSWGAWEYSAVVANAKFHKRARRSSKRVDEREARRERRRRARAERRDAARRRAEGNPRDEAPAKPPSERPAKPPDEAKPPSDAPVAPAPSAPEPSAVAG